VKYHISIRDSGFLGYYTHSTGKYLTSQNIYLPVNAT